MERTQARSLEFKIGRNVWLGLALTGLFTMGAAVSAQAQSAQEEVERLNHEAMEAYHVMDVDRAGGMLEEALRVADDGGVTAAALALTHLNLGVVYIGALGDDAAGGEQFVAGLCLVPELELDPLTSTPQMKDTFTAARQKAAAGNCPTPIATAAGSAPSPAEAAASGYDGYQAEPGMDDETPWDGVERKVDQGRMARFFVQLMPTIGGLWVGEGLEADRPAPESNVFAKTNFGPDGQPLRDASGNLVLTKVEDPRGEWAAHRTAVLTDDQTSPFFNMPLYLPGPTDPGRSDWVPDADSEDYSSALAGSCPADGIATGPLYAADDVNNLFPSKYCVRVLSPGFIMGPALRFNVGYFLTETVSVALVTRLQFGSGAGFMAGMLVGGRGEILILESGTKGLSVSTFFGLTLGQIQARVSSEDNGPWTLTGPVGGHLGSNIRYRFSKNLGIVVGPQIDLLFPAFTYNLDLPVGLEVAF